MICTCDHKRIAFTVVGGRQEIVNAAEVVGM